MSLGTATRFRLCSLNYCHNSAFQPYLKGQPGKLLLTQTILITGASGNIGRKLVQHLKSEYDLRLLDLKGGGGTVAADISKFEDEWAIHFKNVDVVIHLAGEGRPTANWFDCYSANVNGTRNVLRASQLGGVRRVIFASTNQIMGGYRFLSGPVTSDMDPKPLNPYAVSKLICEELGKGFAAETGNSFIALRIGFMQSGDNEPHPGMGIGIWGQQMWLSNGDAMRAFGSAIRADNVSHEVLNLISKNAGSRWDMTKTHNMIGFVPDDRYTPMLSEIDAEEDRVARMATLQPGFWLDQYFNRLG